MKYKLTLFNRARLRLLFVATCALYACLPSTYAVEEDPISVSFYCILWDMSASQIPLCYISEGEKKDLGRLVDTQRSLPFQYRGNPVLRFYDSRAYNADEGSMNIPVASVRIGSRLKEPLLIISKRKDGQLSIFAVEDSQSVYGNDTYRFYNTTSRDIAIKVDDSVMKLRPKSMNHMIPDFKSHPNVHVKAIEIKEDGGIKRLYTNMWPKRKNQRYLCFISDADKRKPSRIKVKVITDFVTTNGTVIESDGLLMPFSE